MRSKSVFQVGAIALGVLALVGDLVISSRPKR
jgi:hypothetical protein